MSNIHMTEQKKIPNNWRVINGGAKLKSLDLERKDSPVFIKHEGGRETKEGRIEILYKKIEAALKGYLDRQSYVSSFMIEDAPRSIEAQIRNDLNFFSQNGYTESDISRVFEYHPAGMGSLLVEIKYSPEQKWLNEQVSGKDEIHDISPAEFWTPKYYKKIALLDVIAKI